jgi:hypothetical protein
MQKDKVYCIPIPAPVYLKAQLVRLVFRLPRLLVQGKAQDTHFLGMSEFLLFRGYEASKNELLS